VHEPNLRAVKLLGLLFKYFLAHPREIGGSSQTLHADSAELPPISLGCARKYLNSSPSSFTARKLGLVHDRIVIQVFCRDNGRSSRFSLLRPELCCTSALAQETDLVGGFHAGLGDEPFAVLHDIADLHVDWCGW